jgi:hypothetical protein
VRATKGGGSGARARAAKRFKQEDIIDLTERVSYLGETKSEISTAFVCV